MNLVASFQIVPHFRYDERRSIAPGGAWLPDAGPTELSAGLVRYHARVLAPGPDEEAHVRNTAVETGGLLHHGGVGIQRSVVILRPRPPPG